MYMMNDIDRNISQIHVAEGRLLRSGFFSAAYFNKLRHIMKEDGHDPVVKMQIFQRGEGILCGVEAVLDLFAHTCVDDAEVWSLQEGAAISPNETVMTIRGRFSEFAHLESVYLGLLARQTRVATNVRKVVNAANGKPVLFMADRFDVYEAQVYDGEAAMLGGAAGICTQAMGHFPEVEAKGTMPHALIAAYGGDTVLAAKKYVEYFPGEPATVLVDFDNDCVGTSLAVARELGSKLGAVRLDTSGNMVDEGVKAHVTKVHEGTTNNLPLDALLAGHRGVNPLGVRLVRRALDDEGFQHVKIIVSGGFTPDKIADFERAGVPVDVYGVGSSLIKNGQDFTADIVEVDGKPCAKVGRQDNPNPKMERRR